MRRIIKSHSVSMDSESAFIKAAGESDVAIDINDEELATLTNEEQARSIGEAIVKEAKSEAERIVKEAEREAEKIYDDVKVKCRELEQTTKDEAHKAGYGEGFAEGEAIALNLEKEAQKKLDDAVAQHKAILDGSEAVMVELIIKVIEKIIGAAAMLSPQLVRVMVKAAMSEISTIGGVKVRVSSHDYADVEAARDEVLALIEGGAELEIIKDLSLGKTDCIIETPFGSVDCSLDTQLSVLKHNVYLILNGE